MFHAIVCSVLLEPIGLHEKHISTEYLSFMTSRKVELQELPGLSCTVKLLFLNHRRLFKYVPHSEKNRWSDGDSTRQRRLVSGVKKALEFQSASRAST